MTYDEIIEQTYISPIRSVIAVDDKFPTLDNLLDRLQEAAKPAAGELAEAATRDQELKITIDAKETGRAAEILKYCRAQKWMVDVHDGASLLEGDHDNLASHLHQTDLLILDYQLEGDAKGGDGAVRILRSIAANRHFNIVIIYTNKNAGEAFREVLLGLLKPSGVVVDAVKAGVIGDKWDDWSRSDEAVMAPFQEVIDAASYLEWRRRGATVSLDDFRNCFPNFQALRAAIGPKLIALPEEQRFKVEDVGAWLISRFEAKHETAMATADLKNFDFKINNDGSVNWIWTESIYLTVVPKTTEGDQLIQRLKTSLCNWHPTPHHIILAKMRALLEDGGGEIEAFALKDEHVQAGLLWEMLEPNIPQRAAVLSRVMERQWTEVLYAMKDEIKPAALALLEQAANTDASRDGAVNHFYPTAYSADQSKNDDVWLRLNSYWSSVPADGHHLKTGHIFEFEDAYWICLSPICDLVPDQNKDKRWRGRLGEKMHFKAVKLHVLPARQALDNVTGGACLFIRIGDEIKTLGFINAKNEDSNPDWEQMFVVGDGALENLAFDVSVVRDASGFLELQAPARARIVGELRYEYALNLLQRLGGNLSRIGLDFVKPPGNA